MDGSRKRKAESEEEAYNRDMREIVEELERNPGQNLDVATWRELKRKRAKAEEEAALQADYEANKPSGQDLQQAQSENERLAQARAAREEAKRLRLEADTGYEGETGGRRRRKSRKARKSRKTRKTRKSRKSRRHR